MELVDCPVCGDSFPQESIEAHVNVCLEAESNSNPPQEPFPDLQADPEEENERLFREFLAQEEANRLQQIQAQELLLRCDLCATTGASKMIFFDPCGHYFCKNCLVTVIMRHVEEKKCSSIKCQTKYCGSTLSPADIKALLSEQQYELYLSNSFGEFVESNDRCVSCPKPGCAAIIEIQNNEQDAALTEAENHKNQFRFRCRQCETEFCASCKRVPYHSGYTCEGFATYQKSRKCRFCGTQLTEKNTAPQQDYGPGLLDVCVKMDCLDKRKFACQHTHQCGHFCGGIRDEQVHLDCLHRGCAKDSNDDPLDCMICYADRLISAPTIQLKCGHMFHYECIKNQITGRWSSANIQFGFLHCPACKAEMHHPGIESLMAADMALYKSVKEKALQRLKYMNEENAQEIREKSITHQNVAGPFYNDPTRYALKRYCYYLCFKCKKPYFGGERACNAEQRVAEDHNPSDLICGSCSGGAKPAAGCTHGTDFIEWKCRYCCQVACWFCWGTTHFCDDCHKQAAAMAKKNKQDHPKCTCKVAHPPNGDEFCLGCSMCKLQPGDF